MAGGQFALFAIVVAAAVLGGMWVQYVIDSLHCDHAHHVENYPPIAMVDPPAD